MARQSSRQNGPGRILIAMIIDLTKTQDPAKGHTHRWVQGPAFFYAVGTGSSPARRLRPVAPPPVFCICGPSGPSRIFFIDPRILFLRLCVAAIPLLFPLTASLSPLCACASTCALFLVACVFCMPLIARSPTLVFARFRAEPVSRRRSSCRFILCIPGAAFFPAAVSRQSAHIFMHI